MRIAYFTDTYEPQINGVVTSIKMSAENLRKKGHTVYIFCPSGSRRDKYTYPVFSKTFKNYPEYRVGFPSLEIVKRIKKIKPDVIHVHTPASIGTAGLMIAKLLNIPTVITYHTLLRDYMNYITSDRLSDKFIDIFTAWFFNISSVVIVPSSPIKKILRKAGVKSSIAVLPTSLNSNIVNKRFKKKNRKLTILHVGRLCKEKRIDVVLNAFKYVLEKADAELIITSSGPDENRLKSLADDLDISRNVRFTGYISNEKLRRLYSTSDIFVSASDTETQGLVVLEAMANGCPVIVKDALGFKDIVKNGRNGILFRDVQEISQKILMLQKNKKTRDRLVREGLKTANIFTPENYNKKIEKLYLETLKMSRTPITDKLFYSLFLLSNISIYWFIKNTNISINSRSINLYLQFIRRFLLFKKILR